MEPVAAPSPEGASGGLLRVRLDLGYDGTAFSGWAVQPGRRTVAGVLGEALATVLRSPDVAETLVVAGRTDAGVHATGQVCHLDVDEVLWAALPGRTERPPALALLRRLAGVLPADVRVHAATVAPQGFDARFAALQRRYRYLVCDDEAGVPPLRRHDVLARRGPLDVEAMDAAARRLVGLHDFAAFCKRREGATTVRTLLHYGWTRTGDGLLEARVEADAFCHSMVRAMVGAVLPVGEGRHGIDWPTTVLAAGQRDARVVVVPPQGLCLVEVRYPDDDGLAARAAQARAVRTLPARDDAADRPARGVERGSPAGG